MLRLLQGAACMQVMSVSARSPGLEKLKPNKTGSKKHISLLHTELAQIGALDDFFFLNDEEHFGIFTY